MHSFITIFEDVVDEIINELLKCHHEILLRLLLQVGSYDLTYLLCHLLYDHQLLLYWCIRTANHATEILQVRWLSVHRWAYWGATTVHRRLLIKIQILLILSCWHLGLPHLILMNQWLLLSSTNSTWWCTLSSRTCSKRDFGSSCLCSSQRWSNLWSLFLHRWALLPDVLTWGDFGLNIIDFCLVYFPNILIHLLILIKIRWKLLRSRSHNLLMITQSWLCFHCLCVVWLWHHFLHSSRTSHSYILHCPWTCHLSCYTMIPCCISNVKLLILQPRWLKLLLDLCL